MFFAGSCLSREQIRSLTYDACMHARVSCNRWGNMVSWRPFLLFHFLSNFVESESSQSSFPHRPGKKDLVGILSKWNENKPKKREKVPSFV